MTSSVLYVVISSVLLSCRIDSLHAALLLDPASVTCTDKTECPDGNTCCPKQGGGFGCCPQQNAVCCDDKIHCCPQNTRCDVAGGGCVPPSNVDQPQWMNRFLSMIGSGDVSSTQQKQDSIAAVEGELSTAHESDVGVEASSVVCPDRTSYCPDYNTCCLMPNHQWICCPLPYAACCPDGFHCCPHGYRCDVHSYRCTLGDPRVAFLTVIVPSNWRKYNKL